jgi:hypothetical protein
MSLELQLRELCNVVLECFPEEIGKGEPPQAKGESAVKVAIRLLRRYHSEMQGVKNGTKLAGAVRDSGLSEMQG